MTTGQRADACSVGGAHHDALQSLACKGDERRDLADVRLVKGRRVEHSAAFVDKGGPGPEQELAVEGVQVCPARLYTVFTRCGSVLERREVRRPVHVHDNQLFGHLKDVEDELLELDPVGRRRLDQPAARTHVGNLLLSHVMHKGVVIFAHRGDEIHRQEVLNNISILEGEASVRAALLGQLLGHFAVLHNAKAAGGGSVCGVDCSDYGRARTRPAAVGTPSRPTLLDCSFRTP